MKTFRVTKDASAVLLQEWPNWDKPLAYPSRRLRPETRYSAAELELLGIVWAVEHIRPYVYGRPSTLLGTISLYSGQGDVWENKQMEVKVGALSVPSAPGGLT